MSLLRILTVLLALLSLTAVALASPEGLLLKGVALLNNGQTEEAIATLLQAEQQFPDRSQLAGLLGEAYLRLGMKQLNGGDEAAARQSFADAKRYLPGDPRGWQATGLAWLHEGQPAAAVGEFQEALAIAGEQPDLLVLLGRAHYAAGELLQAEEAWQKAAELGAGDGVAALLEKVRRERRAETAMRRDLGGRFNIAYAPGVGDDLAAAVLEVLQDAYGDLGGDLGFYPETDIPVLLYAREDFAAVTRSPEWAGAVYDGKIRVPLGGVTHMSAPLRALLYHEYMHVVVRFLGKGRAPVWLNEGMAEAVGRKYFEHVIAVPSSDQRLSVDALERPFTELPDKLVPLAYQASYERVSHLVELCGWSPLGELLQRLGRGAPWDAAVAEAYASCGYDWPRLQQELTAVSAH
jgi:tetratricopeptide (TPR) repeat protein